VRKTDCSRNLIPYRTRLFDKDGEDQLGRSCEKRRNITKNKEGKEYPTNNKRRKANWIGHILRRNCLLRHFIEGKIEVTGKQRKKK
jgi:hypothetical protein